MTKKKTINNRYIIGFDSIIRIPRGIEFIAPSEDAIHNFFATHDSFDLKDLIKFEDDEQMDTQGNWYDVQEINFDTLLSDDFDVTLEINEKGLILKANGKKYND